jgi:hypothetical protein
MTGALSVTRATRQSEYIAALLWFDMQGIQVDAATAVATSLRMVQTVTTKQVDLEKTGEAISNLSQIGIGSFSTRMIK